MNFYFIISQQFSRRNVKNVFFAFPTWHSAHWMEHKKGKFLSAYVFERGSARRWNSISIQTFFRSSGLLPDYYVCLLLLNMNMTDNKSFDWEMSYYLTWIDVRPPPRWLSAIKSFDRMEEMWVFKHIIIIDGHYLWRANKRNSHKI